MGRKWNNKKKKSDGARNTTVEKPKRDRDDPNGYVVAVKENKDFETFYKNQNIVPEEEWSDFICSLQSSLPVAFRITGNSSQGEALLKILKKDFFEPLENMCLTDNLNVANGNNAVIPANGNGTNGAAVEDPIKPLEPKCLEWYPGGLAYQLNLSRRDIRRCEAYWRLHQCLITETDSGCISRQETVSMIPPLLLEVQPHHAVLDMCAAPGSKTAQLIEQLHSSSDPVKGSIPPGVVVANDADNKRCYLLTHQAKRLQSPSIIITNHDAAFMPNMLYTKPDGKTGKVKFDRILCDVPCSGDGTLRKNCDVWTKWNPVNGCNLHGLQLRIARRGLEMLRVGGRMVYSTCSMSPMENEAVLQRLLAEAKGAVTLVDVKDKLPGLKYCPGLTKWSVMTKDMKLLPTPDDIPLEWSNVYHKYLFPSEEDFHLERCLRLLPHHQDTGGFFVAVLEKNAPMPGEAVEALTSPLSTSTAPAPFYSRPQQRVKSKPGQRRQGFKEEPYFYLSDNIAEWEKNFRSGKTIEPVMLSSAATVVHTTASETTATDPQKSVETSEESVAGKETEPSDASSADKPNGSETAGNKEDLRIWSHVSTFFGMSKDIPEASYRNFMTRNNEGRTRTLYFTNSFVRDLIDRNQDRMKIINTGVKVLVRTDNKGATCDFRLAQEGIKSLLPLISGRRVPVTRDDLIRILNDNDNDHPPDLALMSLPCRDATKAYVTGSVLMEYYDDPFMSDDEQQPAAEDQKIKMELVGWKGKNSLRCYVARTDRIHYLRLLRADTSRYETNKFRAAATRPASETMALGEESKQDTEGDCETKPIDEECKEAPKALDEDNKDSSSPSTKRVTNVIEDEILSGNVEKKAKLSDESFDNATSMDTN